MRRRPRRDPRTHRGDPVVLQTQVLTLHARRGPELAEHLPQRLGPLPRGHAGPGAVDRRGHQVAAGDGRLAQPPERAINLGLIAAALRRAQHLERLGSRLRIDPEEAAVLAPEEWARQAIGPAVATDDDDVAGIDPGQPLRLAAHQRRLHVAGLDGLDGAAELVDLPDLGVRRLLEGVHLRRHHRRAVEQVRVLEEIGLVRQDLLQAQRPLLVPRAWQAEGLVPRRELERAAARVAAEDDAEGLDEDTPGVVLGLLLGEPERVDLHAVPEEAVLRIRHRVAVAGDLVPHLPERAQLAHLLDEADAGVAEERDAPDTALELVVRERAALPDGVENAHGGREREGQLLGRRRPGFLQVVGADVRGVPARDAVQAVLVHVDDQPHRLARREDVRPAREIFLDDVVLGGALEARRVYPALLRERDIQREQPHRRRVDGHRGVDLLDGDAVEQDLEVVEAVHRNTHLADLRHRERVIRAVPALRREIERDREAGLAARQVRPIELVRRPDVGMSGVGAEDPRCVARRLSLGVVELVCWASHEFWPLLPDGVYSESRSWLNGRNPPRACAGSAGAPPPGLLQLHAALPSHQPRRSTSAADSSGVWSDVSSQSPTRGVSSRATASRCFQASNTSLPGRRRLRARITSSRGTRRTKKRGRLRRSLRSSARRVPITTSSITGMNPASKTESARSATCRPRRRSWRMASSCGSAPGRTAPPATKRMSASASMCALRGSWCAISDAIVDLPTPGIPDTTRTPCSMPASRARDATRPSARRRRGRRADPAAGVPLRSG